MPQLVPQQPPHGWFRLGVRGPPHHACMFAFHFPSYPPWVRGCFRRLHRVLPLRVVWGCGCGHTTHRQGRRAPPPPHVRPRVAPAPIGSTLSHRPRSPWAPVRAPVLGPVCKHRVKWAGGRADALGELGAPSHVPRALGAPRGDPYPGHWSALFLGNSGSYGAGWGGRYGVWVPIGCRGPPRSSPALHSRSPRSGLAVERGYPYSEAALFRGEPRVPPRSVPHLLIPHLRWLI